MSDPGSRTALDEDLPAVPPTGAGQASARSPYPRPGLREIEPYSAPQLDVPVKLDANECPYPLPAAFARDLAGALLAASASLNRYPDREAVALRRRLAERNGHPIDGVWAANGSNEIIQQLMLAYGGHGRRAVVFEPTYGLHRGLARIAGSDVVTVPLAEPFDITPDRVSRALAADPDVTFVCSPNNPTGTTCPTSLVADLARRTRGLVVVDEAYIEFGGTTAAGLVPDHPNVVVVRTFSKAFALAGLRVGYCLASPDVVQDLRRVRLPYHLSALTQAAALTALEHAGETMAAVDAIREERDRIAKALGTFPEITVFGSQANFVLFRTARPARRIWEGLLRRGVLVRDVSGAVPGCLRVTAGTPAEVDAFLGALQEVLG